MSILEKLSKRSKILLILLLILLLAIVFPTFGKILLGLAIVGLLLYLLYTLFPEIITSLLPKTGKTNKTIRKYVNTDLVKRRPILLEAGIGEVLGKLNEYWFQVFLVEEPIPVEIRDNIRSLEPVAIVTLRGNKEIIIVRDPDPEQVVDYSRLVESMLKSAGIRFRILNPEEAINMLLSLFRTR